MTSTHSPAVSPFSPSSFSSSFCFLRVPRHIHWPCPNKTSIYPKRTQKRETRELVSQFQSQAQALYTHYEGRAIPRTHQTLPWLIRLAWHAAFFHRKPPKEPTLQLDFLFNKCQEKLFFRRRCPIPQFPTFFGSHHHCRSHP